MRTRIRVTGIVQGVGFRPFIYRIAVRNHLTGYVRNRGDAGVEICLLSLADQRATVGYDDDADPSSEGARECRSLLETVTALLDAYFNRRQSVVAPPPLLTGRDLIDQFGLEQGPAIGRLLDALREAQATGQVENRDQAEEWVKRTVRDWRLEIKD